MKPRVYASEWRGWWHVDVPWAPTVNSAFKSWAEAMDFANALCAALAEQP